jgi:uncharacterized protein GlcG (DUF336 family)
MDISVVDDAALLVGIVPANATFINANEVAHRDAQIAPLLGVNSTVLADKVKLGAPAQPLETSSGWLIGPGRGVALRDMEGDEISGTASISGNLVEKDKIATQMAAALPAD